MANFLLIVEEIPDYGKSDIDKGNTPPEIYSVCSCIRTAFCISYGIKKKNNLFIYCQNKNFLIKFEGEKLRYLGPDERSQALLLKKALNTLNNNNIPKIGWIESTPGIKMKKLNNIHSFFSFLSNLNIIYITFVSDAFSPFDIAFLCHCFDVPRIKPLKRLENLNEHFFIIPSSKSTIINLLREIASSRPSILEFITIAILDKIKIMSDKILYINFQIDQVKN